MKPITKVLIFVAVFGIVGVAVWYFTKKKETKPDNGGQPVTDPPPIPPPATQPPPPTGTGDPTPLTDPNSGTGLQAINRRIGEIMSSDLWKEVQDKVRDEGGTDILHGVTESKKNYYTQNISRPPITSPKKVPLRVSPGTKSVLKEFKDIDPEGKYSATAALRTANIALMEEVGTCFVGNPELGGQEEFNKQVICQEYGQNCGNNYSKMDREIQSGAFKAVGDMGRMANAWLAAISSFEIGVRNRAIEDLRLAGWRFIGFDA